jgi:hypothetical protein
MTKRQAKKVFHVWVLEPHRCGSYKIGTYGIARRKLKRMWTREAVKNLRELTPEQRRHFGIIKIPVA